MTFEGYAPLRNRVWAAAAYSGRQADVRWPVGRSPLFVPDSNLSAQHPLAA
jgi:hypothetical protein